MQHKLENIIFGTLIEKGEIKVTKKASRVCVHLFSGHLRE
jgi:hypothetical protein